MCYESPKNIKNASIYSILLKSSIRSYDLSSHFGRLFINPQPSCLFGSTSFICTSAMKIPIVTLKKKKRIIKNTIIVKILKYEEGLLLHIG